jgi:tetratricopeptide (TPR) repeat protein
MDSASLEPSLFAEPSDQTIASVSSSRTGKRAKVVLAVLALAVIVGGGTTGWLLRTWFFPLQVKPDYTDAGETRPTRGPTDPVTTRNLVEDLRRIDSLILESRYAEAADECRRALPAAEVIPPALRYRFGLAIEGAGRPVEALPHYRACITTTATPHLRTAAQLGLARAGLHAGPIDESRALLCSLLARASEPLFRAHPYEADAANLLALSLAREVLGSGSPEATRLDALAGPLTTWPVDRYLPFGDPPLPTTTSSSSGPTPRTGQFELTGAGLFTDNDRLTASLPRAELIPTLERIATGLELKLQWGEGAQEALVGRTIEMLCRSVEITTVLDWLTLSHGLVHEIDRRTLTVKSFASLKPSEKSRYRRGQAQRWLRGALESDRGHPMIGDLYVALGNLEATQDKRKEAITWFVRLAREDPRSPANIAGHYNLGLLHLSANDRSSARDAFFRVIDQTPGNELVALSYWWIGRSYLDEKDSPAALRAFARAQQGASSSTAPAVALGLACLHALNNEPERARDALSSQRQAIQQGVFAEPAGFLDTFVRYRLVASDNKASLPVAAKLLTALSPRRDESWLGPAMPFLRGQAMRQLGLSGQMVDLYDRTTRNVQGPLVDEMNSEAADALIALARPERARPRLEMLFQTGSPRWSARAGLRLAELDLLAGQSDRCLNRCRDLLDRPGVDRPAVLALMSRTYTARREFTQAAEALAGRVPPP